MTDLRTVVCEEAVYTKELCEGFPDDPERSVHVPASGLSEELQLASSCHNEMTSSSG